MAEVSEMPDRLRPVGAHRVGRTVRGMVCARARCNRAWRRARRPGTTDAQRPRNGSTNIEVGDEERLEWCGKAQPSRRNDAPRCRPPARYWGALAVTFVTVSGPELTSEYHHAFEALPVGVCIIDRTGSIVSVNRALEQQLGYTRSELVGQDATLLLSIPIDTIQSALRERSDSAARATPSAAQAIRPAEGRNGVPRRR